MCHLAFNMALPHEFVGIDIYVRATLKLLFTMKMAASLQVKLCRHLVLVVQSIGGRQRLWSTHVIQLMAVSSFVGYLFRHKREPCQINTVIQQVPQATHDYQMQKLP